VVQTTDGGRDAAIAQAIISPRGTRFRLRVLPEGVETPEQLEFLRRHGCKEYQGYLFSRPCAAEAVSDFSSSKAHRIGSSLKGRAERPRADQRSAQITRKRSR